MGSGPEVVLIHGTGSSTHTWRDLAPLLARRFRVVAMDLPGHGHTENPADDRLSLPGMTAAVCELLRSLNVRPALLVGHSAGAAVALRACLDGALQPSLAVSLNGALLPPEGLAGAFFSPVARMLSLNPMVPRWFAWRCRKETLVDRLLDATGSRIDERGRALYARLLRDPGHTAGALGMMARWDLRPLVADLPRLALPLLLISGVSDATVPPSQADRIWRLLPGTVRRTIAGGHLAHEEHPARIAALLAEHGRDAGVGLGRGGS